MTHKEEGPDNGVSGKLSIELRLSSPDQEGKTITISENEGGFEVVTSDASGSIERKTLQHCG